MVEEKIFLTKEVCRRVLKFKLVTEGGRREGGRREEEAFTLTTTARLLSPESEVRG